MATGYYLQDNPNPYAAQYGWERSWVSGVIGVHTAENNTCFNGPDPGDQDVAGFISRRSDFGSYHTLVDADSINQLVHPRWAAWADTTNNAHGMSVSAAVRANDWLSLSEDRRRQVHVNLGTAAAWLVKDALNAGLLKTAPPARRITPAQAIAGSAMGFYGHGETNPGTRYDPGKDFNWTLFLSAYEAAMGGDGIVPAGNVDAPKVRQLIPGVAGINY